MRLLLIAIALISLTPRVRGEIVVETHAFGGFNTAMLRPYVDQRISSTTKFHIAIVMAGTNDATNSMAGLSPSAFAANLTGILQQLHDTGARVYVAEILPQIDSVVKARKGMTQNPNDIIRRYNLEVRTAAEATSSTLIEIFDEFSPHAILPEDWIIGTSNDGIHPTLAGMQSIAETFRREISPAVQDNFRIVLFGDSLLQGYAFGGAPNRPGDMLQKSLNSGGSLIQP